MSKASANLLKMTKKEANVKERGEGKIYSISPFFLFTGDLFQDSLGTFESKTFWFVGEGSCLCTCVYVEGRGQPWVWPSDAVHLGFETWATRLDGQCFLTELSSKHPTFRFVLLIYLFLKHGLR